MATAGADNPFVDPVDVSGNRSSFAADSTLAVGRNASLTLGTDALIVLDEKFEKDRGCCGFGTGTANTRAIPFYNILWASTTDSTLTITYATPISKSRIQPATLTYTLESSTSTLAPKWTAKLLDRSYGSSQQQKRAKVLVNPHSGQGSAQKWYARDVQPLLSAANCTIDMVTTRYQGEAVEISQKLDIEAYDIIVTCSGDGLAHEVFNGLGKRPDARKALGRIAVTHVPCGSGNAMSCNLSGTSSPSLATLAIIKGLPTPLDLVSITQGGTRTLSFLSQSVGIVAESDLATEHLRWMGMMRFNVGFLMRLAGKRVYPCDIAVGVAIEGKEEIKNHYRREIGKKAAVRGGKGEVEDDASASSGKEDEEGLPVLRYGTVNDKLPEGWELVPYDKLGNFYCGNMAYMASDANFFSPALPNDGYLDLVCINGDISRLSAIQMMLAVESNKLFDHPGVWYRKITGYRIIPKDQDDGYISIDGERVPFEPFQAEVHRGLGTVLTKSGFMYEAPGPV